MTGPGHRDQPGAGDLGGELGAQLRRDHAAFYTSLKEEFLETDEELLQFERQFAEQLERTGAMVTRLTAEHTGQPADRIERDGLRDRWFSPEEALEYGIIDHIVERVEDVRPSLVSRTAGL